jgi:hypothetical protein
MTKSQKLHKCLISNELYFNREEGQIPERWCVEQVSDLPYAKLDMALPL